ncbi:MAG: GNAT family N-acetyltransferase [Rickettsiales bacterium]|jgi:putative hemolysin|nr:GNAT family N-acetyltransferase [Rickettsiales bacterium]
MAIKIRDYEVRLTKTKEERRQVRQLRYRVFVLEEGATPTEEQRELGEEYDSYDRFAEYMGVFHGDRVVGCYRIIDRAAAEKMDGFYSEIEFDISKIKKARGNIAEMSRACVDPEYRDNSLVMRMLWLGLGDYIAKKKIAILFGMASWFGVKPLDYAMATSHLYYNHLAPLSLRATVDFDKLPPDSNPKLTRMNILPREFVNETDAYAQMGAILKGYLRLGAKFGNGVSLSNDAFKDTYSVFVMMQTKNISRVYQKHFAGDENAFADLGLKPGAWKTFGKILFSPVTGMMALAKFFLKPEDAAEVKRVDD